MKINFLKMTATVLVSMLAAATSAQVEPELTVKEIMNALITPTTATIWGAYELQTDAEWQEVGNAALAVIAAGNLLGSGGADDSFQQAAKEQAWQEHNQAMIAAARAVLDAVAARDEEALFAAGNDQLYPPCESCHQQYQAR
jgi:cytochrome c556